MSNIYWVLKYIPCKSNVIADLLSRLPADEVIPNVYTFGDSGINELINDN
jgi:hypothetical protein